MHHGHVKILGCRVDNVDMRDAAERILRFIHRGHPAHVVTFGAEMAMLAERDARYRRTINNADLIVADSIGIVAASRLLRRPLPGRIAGIDLMELLCEGAAHSGAPVYLLGAAEGVARDAAEALQNAHPGLVVVGTHHGFFSDDESEAIADRIRASGARLAFVALGFPRQEFWIHENLRRVGPATCIGVGGAFDVLAGRIGRAPKIVQRLGLEWLYRLVREPRRLGRQLALPAFALRVLGQAMRRPDRQASRRRASYGSR